MNSKIKIQENLSDYEAFYSNCLAQEHIKVIGDLYVSEEELASIRDNLKSLIELETDYYFLRAYKVTLSIFLVWTVHYHFDEGNLWGSIFTYLQLPQTTNLKKYFGDIFLETINEKNLCVVENTSRDKYYTPILMHGYLAKSNYPQFLEEINNLAEVLAFELSKSRLEEKVNEWLGMDPLFWKEKKEVAKLKEEKKSLEFLTNKKNQKIKELERIKEYLQKLNEILVQKNNLFKKIMPLVGSFEMKEVFENTIVLNSSLEKSRIALVALEKKQAKEYQLIETETVNLIDKISFYEGIYNIDKEKANGTFLQRMSVSLQTLYEENTMLFFDFLYKLYSKYVAFVKNEALDLDDYQVKYIEQWYKEKHTLLNSLKAEEPKNNSQNRVGIQTKARQLRKWKKMNSFKINDPQFYFDRVNNSIIIYFDEIEVNFDQTFFEESPNLIINGNKFKLDLCKKSEKMIISEWRHEFPWKDTLNIQFEWLNVFESWDYNFNEINIFDCKMKLVEGFKLKNGLYYCIFNKKFCLTSDYIIEGPYAFNSNFNYAEVEFKTSEMVFESDEIKITYKNDIEKTAQLCNYKSDGFVFHKDYPVYNSYMPKLKIDSDYLNIEHIELELHQNNCCLFNTRLSRLQELEVYDGEYLVLSKLINERYDHKFAVYEIQLKDMLNQETWRYSFVYMKELSISVEENFLYLKIPAAYRIRNEKGRLEKNEKEKLRKVSIEETNETSVDIYIDCVGWKRFDFRIPYCKISLFEDETQKNLNESFSRKELSQPNKYKINFQDDALNFSKIRIYSGNGQYDVTYQFKNGKMSLDLWDIVNHLEELITLDNKPISFFADLILKTALNIKSEFKKHNQIPLFTISNEWCDNDFEYEVEIHKNEIYLYIEILDRYKSIKNLHIELLNENQLLKMEPIKSNELLIKIENENMVLSNLTMKIVEKTSISDKKIWKSKETKTTVLYEKNIFMGDGK